MGKRVRNAPFSQRKSQNKPPRKRFVIICEGARTETDYCNHLLQEWRSRFKKVDNYVSIEILGPEAAGGNEPENLIEYAIDTLRETEKARRIWDKSSQIWCVFDVEAEGGRKNLTNSVSHAKAKKIQLVISNPCFELWLYLHHQYCDTAFTDGKSMKAHLKKWWSEYEKNAGKFSALDELRGTATKNAKRLRKNPHTKLPSDPVPRPYTDVDILIAHIETILADIR